MIEFVTDGEPTKPPVKITRSITSGGHVAVKANDVIVLWLRTDGTVLKNGARIALEGLGFQVDRKGRIKTSGLEDKETDDGD